MKEFLLTLSGIVIVGLWFYWIVAFVVETFQFGISDSLKMGAKIFAIITAVVLGLLLLVSAGVYFKKSWEHINQSPCEVTINQRDDGGIIWGD